MNKIKIQYSSLVNDTLASNNPLQFRNNLSKRLQKIIMTINGKIKDEKLWYDINREAAKVSAILAGKFGKYEYLTS